MIAHAKRLESIDETKNTRGTFFIPLIVNFPTALLIR